MDSFLGEILFFAGRYVPEGFVACNGQLLKIQEYNALYSLLGTTYGGDGVTNFAVPDLQARIPVGFGQRTGTTTNYPIGQKFGKMAVTLNTSNLPPHTHAMAVDSSSQPGIASPTGALLTNAAETGTGFASCYVAPTTANLVSMAAETVTVAGGASNPAPVDNRMPTTALTPIMCVMGEYPVRP